MFGSYVWKTKKKKLDAYDAFVPGKWAWKCQRTWDNKSRVNNLILFLSIFVLPVLRLIRIMELSDSNVDKLVHLCVACLCVFVRVHHLHIFIGYIFWWWNWEWNEMKGKNEMDRNKERYYIASLTLMAKCWRGKKTISNKPYAHIAHTSSLTTLQMLVWQKSACDIVSIESLTRQCVSSAVFIHSHSTLNDYV